MEPIVIILVTLLVILLLIKITGGTKEGYWPLRYDKGKMRNEVVHQMSQSYGDDLSKGQQGLCPSNSQVTFYIDGYDYSTEPILSDGKGLLTVNSLSYDSRGMRYIQSYCLDGLEEQCDKGLYLLTKEHVQPSVKASEVVGGVRDLVSTFFTDSCYGTLWKLTIA